VKIPPFDYHIPHSTNEAVAMLDSLGEDAKLIAGGQSLIPMLALRMSRFSDLIDLGSVGSLRGVSIETGRVTVGAMTTQSAVERDPAIRAALPLLSNAVGLIGHFQIRSRGTIGGSLAHAEPAAELPAVACAVGAEFCIVGPTGERRVAAADFFQSTWTTALDHADVLTAVEFPIWGSGSAITEIARRHGDFAIAGACCCVDVRDEKVSAASVYLFGVSSTPWRCREAEVAMTGCPVADLDLTELGRAAVVELEPFADLHASSGYRSRAAAALVERAIGDAIKGADVE